MTLPDQASAIRPVGAREALPDPRVVAVQSDCETPEAQSLREQAWASIYVEHVTPLTSYAQRICGDPYVAEDSVQEAFEKAIKRIGKFEDRGPGSLSRWLTIVTHNATIDCIRKRKDVPVGNIMEETDQPPFQPMNSPNAEPFHRVTYQETLEELEDGLVPTNYSALLANVAGLTAEENAKLHGVTRASINSRIHRGRQAAKKIIGRAA